MVWSKSDQHLNNGFVSPLVPDDVYYYFDGPILFTIKLGPIDFLVYKADEAEETDILLVKQVTKSEITRLIEGRLSLRGALQSSDYWLVEATRELDVLRTWVVGYDDLPSNYMPRPGLGLAPGQVGLPDTLLQTEAFFSVKFGGSALKRKEISFGLFKELTDSFYNVSTRMLKPLAIIGMRGREVFDLPMHPPQFASLLVALKQPIIDIAVVANKQMARGEHEEQDYMSEVFSRRNDFFNLIGDVALQANRGSVSKVQATQHLGILEALWDLLPSKDSSVQTTEFSANSESTAQHIHLDAHAGSVIRLALQQVQAEPRTVTGRIEIVNTRAGTFVIRDIFTYRQTTCYMRREYFDHAAGTLDLRVGNVAVITGEFSRRKYRDQISAQNPPLFRPPGPLEFD